MTNYFPLPGSHLRLSELERIIWGTNLARSCWSLEVESDTSFPCKINRLIDTAEMHADNFQSALFPCQWYIENPGFLRTVEVNSAVVRRDSSNSLYIHVIQLYINQVNMVNAQWITLLEDWNRQSCRYRRFCCLWFSNCLFFSFFFVELNYRQIFNNKEEKVLEHFAPTPGFNFYGHGFMCSPPWLTALPMAAAGKWANLLVIQEEGSVGFTCGNYSSIRPCTQTH